MSSDGKSLDAQATQDAGKRLELQTRTFRGMCLGEIKAGVRCCRASVFENNRCKLHGGVNSPEYIAGVLERIAYNRERKLYRAARRARKAARGGGDVSI